MMDHLEFERDLGAWIEEARRQRLDWKRDGVPISKRRPLLLEALNKLYGRSKDLRYECGDTRQ